MTKRPLPNDLPQSYDLQQSPFFLTSPLLVSSPRTDGIHMLDLKLDGRAMMDDFVMLTTTGHCTFEILSRQINRKMWGMTMEQKNSYFEAIARVLKASENDPDMAGVLMKFCKGDVSLTTLSHLLMDSYNAVIKNVEIITSTLPVSPAMSWNRSPWSMYNMQTPAEITKQNSLLLDDRKWLGMGTPQQLHQQLQPQPHFSQHMDMKDHMEEMAMSRSNVRQKTLSALHRMKQFVLPTGVVKQDMQDNLQMPHGNMGDNMGLLNQGHSSFEMQDMGEKNTSTPPVDSAQSSQLLSNYIAKMSPPASRSDNIVCRRKKPKVGPKGLSRTGSTWRVQVQVRGGVFVDQNGLVMERKKYRFSRYIPDFIEALWMYEVAILLSDRPKDLQAQMENGNYNILLDEKVVTSPDSYYLELGVRVSLFVHAERSRDNNEERILAIQAYDAMKPLSGFSLLELGQSIVSLGPLYSNIPKERL